MIRLPGSQKVRLATDVRIRADVTHPTKADPTRNWGTQGDDTWQALLASTADSVVHGHHEHPLPAPYMHQWHEALSWSRRAETVEALVANEQEDTSGARTKLLCTVPRPTRDPEAAMDSEASITVDWSMRILLRE
ncbi:hypothetical protein LTS09_017990 [Friedmanniomyces endolithicus]|nr:hypothetical protein LTS09_017990 [Friedmanniomyces endolithicus]